MMRSTFPDAYVTLEDVIAEDDKVVSRGTFTGTHRRDSWYSADGQAGDVFSHPY